MSFKVIDRFALPALSWDHPKGEYFTIEGKVYKTFVAFKAFT